MTCEQYEEKINMLIDDELQDDEKEELLKHLESCGECKENYEMLLKMKNAFADAEIAAPETLHNDIMQKVNAAAIRKKRHKRPLPFAFIAAAAAVIIITLTNGDIEKLFNNKTLTPDMSNYSSQSNTTNQPSYNTNDTTASSPKPDNPGKPDSTVTNPEKAEVKDSTKKATSTKSAASAKPKTSAKESKIAEPENKSSSEHVNAGTNATEIQPQVETKSAENERQNGNVPDVTKNNSYQESDDKTESAAAEEAANGVENIEAYGVAAPTASADCQTALTAAPSLKSASSAYNYGKQGFAKILKNPSGDVFKGLHEQTVLYESDTESVFQVSTGYLKQLEQAGALLTDMEYADLDNSLSYGIIVVKK
ncbi:MAG: zf-HC2 domain-containing protein [Bacillota bacterium]|nr:zf-HC2 domain-containing protein [Bacillota bacterium]